MSPPALRTTAVLAAAATVTSGLAGRAVAARRRATGRRVGAGSSRLPLAVTVRRPQDEVDRHVAVDALRAGTDLEVLLRPAPGDRGTEVRLRPREGLTWDDLDAGRAREALRDAKSLMECGDVVEPTSPGNARTTPLNAVLADTTDHAREEGRL